MLVLSRKVGESIVINERIRFTVNRISGSRVAISFDAPQDVHIRRGELEPRGLEYLFNGVSAMAGDEPANLKRVAR